MNTAVQLSDVNVIYPDGLSEIRALDHVDFRLNSGELTAVVGESGSGKSTLLSVVGGLIVPTSGTVEADGLGTLDSEKARTTLRRDITSIVFQAPNLLGSLTVAEQLIIAEHIRGGSTKKAAVRANELLERVGLGGMNKRKISELSGGQRQRVNIARALMKSPAVLLADEPTSALDTSTSEKVVELLATLTKESGIATLMITHNRNQLSVADRVIDMVDGRTHEMHRVS